MHNHTKQVVSSLTSHTESVECVKFSPSSATIPMAATGGMDKKLVIWDLQHSTPRLNVEEYAQHSLMSKNMLNCPLSLTLISRLLLNKNHFKKKERAFTIIILQIPVDGLENDLLLIYHDHMIFTEIILLQNSVIKCWSLLLWLWDKIKSGHYTLQLSIVFASPLAAMQYHYINIQYQVTHLTNDWSLLVNIALLRN